MNLLKFGKYIISSVVCSCLISGCEQSSNTTDLSFKDPQPVAAQSLSIWADMGESFHLGAEERPEVAVEIASLRAHKDELYKVLEASAPYISYVFEETKRLGLPAELALLPIVESQGNPNAKSKVGAKGLWQLMPRTATDLGIKTNQSYDGRKDVIATTKAALAFLADLHKAFEHDWLLAMAAYNWGPGKLQKAIKSQELYTGSRLSPGWQNSHFWDLHVPTETRKYVPRVLAIAAIISDPVRYGFTLPEPDMRTKLASVEVHSAYELTDIIQKSGASIETLQRLNPAYRHLATTRGAPNTFLVPVAREEVQLASNLAIVDNAELNSMPQHRSVIRRGVRLASSLSDAVIAGSS